MPSNRVTSARWTRTAPARTSRGFRSVQLIKARLDTRAAQIAPYDAQGARTALQAGSVPVVRRREIAATPGGHDALTGPFSEATRARRPFGRIDAQPSRAGQSSSGDGEPEDGRDVVGFEDADVNDRSWGKPSATQVTVEIDVAARGRIPNSRAERARKAAAALPYAHHADG